MHAIFDHPNSKMNQNTINHGYQENYRNIKNDCFTVQASRIYKIQEKATSSGNAFKLDTVTKSHIPN